MALEIKRDIFPVSDVSFSQDCAQNLYWVIQSQRNCVAEIRVLLQHSYRFGGPYSDSLLDARSVFESRWGKRCFSSPYPYRQALRPTRTPLQRGPELFHRGKAAGA
jgi:hypothetical protein